MVTKNDKIKKLYPEAAYLVKTLSKQVTFSFFIHYS